jgi:hypothetical protein
MFACGKVFFFLFVSFHFLSSLRGPNSLQGFVLTHKIHTLWVKGLILIKEVFLLMN